MRGSDGMLLASISAEVRLLGRPEAGRSPLGLPVGKRKRQTLLYAYYALAQLLFGRGLFAVHVLTAVVSVPLTALAASAVFRHDRCGVAAGLPWLVYGASFLAHDMLAAR